jgi:hypothetical protein
MIMKFRLLVLLFSAFFILSLGNVTLASEKEKESKVTKFESRQLPNEVLYEKALKGELVNNEHTQVTVSEQKEEGTKTIKIHKVLSEEILPNGEKNTVNSSEYTILLAGYIESVKAPASTSVGLRIKMEYDAKQLGGFSTRKITRYVVTPLRFDSSFEMTYLEYRAITFGTGFTSTGATHTASENTGLKQVTDLTYSMPITGAPNFQKYSILSSDVISETSVLGKFEYRRGSGSILTHSFKLGW